MKLEGVPCIMFLNKAVFCWILFGCSVCNINVAQDLSTSFIEWNEQDALEWNDFRFRKGKSEKTNIAITTVRLSARGYMKNGVPDFEVKALFVKQESWTTDSTDIALLQHEQLHFDIGELYAQKIREKIDELKSEGEQSPKVYRGAINNLITLFKAYSGQYDSDTEHGTIQKRQIVWNQRINKLLY